MKSLFPDALLSRLQKTRIIAVLVVEEPQKAVSVRERCCVAELMPWN